MRRRKLDTTTDDLPAILLALAHRGWTVADLAAATGADAAELQLWLRGLGSISQAAREAVARCLSGVQLQENV